MIRQPKKLILPLAFCLASFAFAQTYDLPIIFVDTKQQCLDNKLLEKIPATMKVLDGQTNNVADSAKGAFYNIGIKVRGQSSAMFPKPGYSVLGFPWPLRRQEHVTQRPRLLAL